MFLSILASLSAPAAAQDLELPPMSPRATVSQQIGTATVTVDYGSPAKRDREVFGGLVPFDKLWRSGANAATTFTTDANLTVADASVPPGTYSVFTMPADGDQWTLILNSNARASTGSYDESLDVARVQVKAAEGPDRERLLWLFTDTTDDSSLLAMEWAGRTVHVPIKVDTRSRANQSIDRYVGSVSRKLAQAGQYRAEGGDVEGGLDLIERSLAIEETWYATWIKAQVLKESGDAKGAYKAAAQAKKLGDAAGGGFFYKDRVEAALAEWPKR